MIFFCVNCDNCGLDRIFPINRSIFVHTWTYGINSSASGNLKHFGNTKNENLLTSPILYGVNEFLVKMCKSQLITEILSFFCFSQFGKKDWS